MPELTQENNIENSNLASKKKGSKATKTSKSIAIETASSQLLNGITKEYIKKLLKEIEKEDDTIILNKKNREIIKQCDKDLIESENDVRQNKNHMMLQIINNLELEDYDSPLNDIMDNYGAVVTYLNNRGYATAIMKWQMDDYWIVKLFHKELELIVKRYEEFRTNILMSLN